MRRSQYGLSIRPVLLAVATCASHPHARPGDHGFEVYFLVPDRAGGGCAISHPERVCQPIPRRGSFESDQWRVRDLGSSNGIFVDGNRVPDAAIEDALTIRLGIEGPFVSFASGETEGGTRSVRLLRSTAVFAARYFRTLPQVRLSASTRRWSAAHSSRCRRSRREKVPWHCGRLDLGHGRDRRIRLLSASPSRQQTAMAKEIFYAMKSLQVDLAGVEKLVRDSQNQQGADQVTKYRSRQKEMETNYERFLTSLRVYDPKMPEEQGLSCGRPDFR